MSSHPITFDPDDTGGPHHVAKGDLPTRAYYAGRLAHRDGQELAANPHRKWEDAAPGVDKPTWRAMRDQWEAGWRLAARGW